MIIDISSTSLFVVVRIYLLLVTATFICLWLTVRVRDRYFIRFAAFFLFCAILANAYMIWRF